MDALYPKRGVSHSITACLEPPKALSATQMYQAGIRFSLFFALERFRRKDRL